MEMAKMRFKNPLPYQKKQNEECFGAPEDIFIGSVSFPVKEKHLIYMLITLPKLAYSRCEGSIDQIHG
jgi:hypothetical protein